MAAAALLLLRPRLARRLGGLLLLWEEVVCDGVEESAPDGDAAADHLGRGHRLAECDCAANDDDGALCRVCDRMGHAGDLAERERRHLVVEVEGEAGHDQVEAEAGVAGEAVVLPDLEEGVHLLPLARDEDGRNQQQRRPQRPDRVRVCAAADRCLHVARHRLLVLLPAKGGSDVGAARGGEAGPREVELGRRRDADPADDRHEHQQLCA
mmetsp:Transcript_30271/g.94596  ORF Transcript_30271/g.94596 Transcript_30271/m.94596 type:complete len:210 (+) Transcript_30271:334-963(+)